MSTDWHEAHPYGGTNLSRRIGDLRDYLQPVVDRVQDAWHAKNDEPPTDDEGHKRWPVRSCKDLAGERRFRAPYGKEYAATCGCDDAFPSWTSDNEQEAPVRAWARMIVADALCGLLSPSKYGLCGWLDRARNAFGMTDEQATECAEKGWAPWEPLDAAELVAGIDEACNMDLDGYRKRRIGNNGLPIETEAFLRAETARDAARPVRVRYSISDLDALPATPALIAGLLDQSSVTMLLGKNQSYKSFTALGWALSLATGEPWCGHAVAEPRPVTYVAGEDLTRGIPGRVGAYLAAHGLDAPDGSMFSLMPGFQLDDKSDVDTLIAECRERGDALVVLDTLHKMTANLDENSNSAMGVALASIERIRTETGAAVLVLHHTGHEGVRARGASALEDDADTVWLLTNPANGARRREFTCRKQKNTEQPRPRQIEFVKCSGSGFVRLLDASTVIADENEVLEVDSKPVAADGPISAEQAATLLTALGCPPGAGERPTLAFIKEKGLKIPASIARAAVKIRKAA
jgi:hypothetical protein